MSETVERIDRKLHAIRRSFRNELQSVLNDVASTDGLSKENFAKSNTHLEPLWREVVGTTEDYIAAIENDGAE